MGNIELKENIIMLILGAVMLVLNFVGFIVVYFIWKDMRYTSYYIGKNGRELLNFNLSYLLYIVISSILCIVLVGAVLLPIVNLAYIILSVIGLFKYGNNQDYRYPFTINFIS